MTITYRKAFHSSLSLRGFSLVELMVTIAIVILVTGVSLARYGSFNNSVLLKSQAFELALDIREAQTFGISVSGRSNDDFRGAFGVHFNIDESTNVYRLFQSEVDNRYQNGEQVGDSLTIDPRFLITSITTDQVGCNPRQASIAFRRPNFDAILWTNGGGACTTPGWIRLDLAAAVDPAVTRSVVVYQSGLITVE